MRPWGNVTRTADRVVVFQFEPGGPWQAELQWGPETNPRTESMTKAERIQMCPCSNTPGEAAAYTQAHYEVKETRQLPWGTRRSKKLDVENPPREV